MKTALLQRTSEIGSQHIEGAKKPIARKSCGPVMRLACGLAIGFLVVIGTALVGTKFGVPGVALCTLIATESLLVSWIFRPLRFK